MDRRTFLKSTAGVLVVASSPVEASVPTPWWWQSGFVPSGPVRPWRAKICFGGLFPSRGETEVWGRGLCSVSPNSGPWTQSGWSPVTVLTRGQGLDVFRQAGWIEGGTPFCVLSSIDRTQVPHPDSEAARIAFPVPEWVLTRVPLEVRS